MKFTIFFIFVVFSVLPTKYFPNQDSTFILGKWKICRDSVTDNAPTFLSCNYTIVINENGEYSIREKGTLVGYGQFEISKYNGEFKKELYHFNFDENDGLSVKLSSFFPKESFVFLTSKQDAIHFIDNEDKVLKTPYFLKRLINE